VALAIPEYLFHSVIYGYFTYKFWRACPNSSYISAFILQSVTHIALAVGLCPMISNQLPEDFPMLPVRPPLSCVPISDLRKLFSVLGLVCLFAFAALNLLIDILSWKCQTPAKTNTPHNTSTK
jgi:hypothetical protein